MANLNRIILIGRLTADPEVRFTVEGTPMAKFSLAVDRVPREGVDFIDVVAWRRLAEICGEYLKKGRPVAVEGKLHVRTFEKAGEKRTMAEVVADTMQMLGRKPEEAVEPEVPEVGEETGDVSPGEEIPF